MENIFNFSSGIFFESKVKPFYIVLKSVML